MQNDNLKKLHVTFKRGDVFETQEKFKTSIFRMVYDKGYQLVSDIVSNESEESQKGNIIAFLGERGSGKTTAMLSFFKELNNPNIFKKYGISPEHYFLTLEPVDASLLERKEDLAVIFLGEMLDNLLSDEISILNKNERFTGMYRSLLTKLEKAYESLHSIHSLKEENEVYPLTALRNHTNSSKVRNQFAELVKEYLNYMALSNNRQLEKSYLVFAIDDLDMNIDQGFEMLEQLHRYLLVPNVIVLVAMKYEQMELLGNKAFHGLFPSRLERETYSWEENYLNVTSKEFLDKMLPLHQRLYMSSIAKDDELMLTNIVVDNEKEVDVREDVRYLLFTGIYRRTGLLFDGTIEERHYLEPKSVRELNDYYWFIEELPVLNLKSEDKDGTYESNIIKFTNDFKNRYIKANIFEPMRTGVEEVIQSPKDQLLKKIKEFIVESITLDIEDRTYQTDKWTRTYRDSLYEIFKENDLSVGDILWGLQFFSEKSSENKRVTDIFVLYLSVIENRKHKTISFKSNFRNGNENTSYFGNSLFGNWGNEICPRIRTINLNGDILELYPGYLKGIKNEGIGINISIKRKFDTETSIINWIEGHKSEFRCLELLFMLFNNFKSGVDSEYLKLNANYIFSNLIKTKKQENGSTESPQQEVVRKLKGVSITINNNSCDYDLFGFIPNSFSIENYFRNFHKEFFKSLLALVPTMENEDKSVDEIIKYMCGYIEKSNISLLVHFKNWNRFYGNSLLPVEQIDLIYQLLCKLKKENLFDAEVYLNSSLSIFSSMLKSIIQKLSEIDEYYYDLHRYDLNTEYAVKFSKYPFVNAIINPEQYGIDEKYLNSCLGKIIFDCNGAHSYQNIDPVKDNIRATEELLSYNSDYSK